MATNKLQWKRIAKGDKLPCQSFLRKKDGEILKLSTIGGVEVGQDCYYLPVDDVIEEIKNYPIEESKDEEIINNIKKVIGWYRGMFTEKSLMPEQYQEIDAWLEKQGEQKSIWHNEDEEPQRDSLILLVMQSGTPIVAKIIEPNHTFNHGERWAYIDDLLEKQVEPTDIPDDAVLDSNKDGLIADTIRCKTEKQEWSEEDEWCLEQINFLIRNSYSVDDKVERLSNWLKSLRPQKNNWERVTKEIYFKEPVLVRRKDKSDSWEGYRVCNDYTLNPQTDECYIRIKDINNQRQWRPSEEQMVVLNDIIIYGHLSNANERILKGLQEQLKKLREE